MLQITLVKKQQLASNTWQFVFKKPKEFVFRAGQYTTVFLDNDNRDFTIAANPLDPDYFSIITKSGVSIFKKNLFALAPNAKITMKEPAGGFILSDTKVRKVFLAGGIGMTPFYAMIHEQITNTISMTLLVSFSKKNHMIFYDELYKLSKQNKHIRVIYSMSQEKWDGETGRISETLIKKHIPNFKKVEFMIAGGEAMVMDTEKLLLEMKVPQENIRIDIFTGY